MLVDVLVGPMTTCRGGIVYGIIHWGQSTDNKLATLIHGGGLMKMA